MALPQPFSSIAQLVAFANYNAAGTIGRQSISPGSFLHSNLDDALKFARAEIYIRCGRKQNSEYDEFRTLQLTLAERYWATSILMTLMAHRKTQYPINDVSGNVGELSINVESPTIIEKSNQTLLLAETFRNRALELMENKVNNFAVHVSKARHKTSGQCDGWNDYPLYCQGDDYQCLKNPP